MNLKHNKDVGCGMGWYTLGMRRQAVIDCPRQMQVSVVVLPSDTMQCKL